MPPIDWHGQDNAPGALLPLPVSTTAAYPPRAPTQGGALPRRRGRRSRRQLAPAEPAPRRGRHPHARAHGPVALQRPMVQSRGTCTCRRRPPTARPRRDTRVRSEKRVSDRGIRAKKAALPTSSRDADFVSARRTPSRSIGWHCMEPRSLKSPSTRELVW